jgi:hypothetical protein
MLNGSAILPHLYGTPFWSFPFVPYFCLFRIFLFTPLVAASLRCDLLKMSSNRASISFVITLRRYLVVMYGIAQNRAISNSFPSKPPNGGFAPKMAIMDGASFERGR